MTKMARTSVVGLSVIIWANMASAGILNRLQVSLWNARASCLEALVKLGTNKARKAAEKDTPDDYKTEPYLLDLRYLDLETRIKEKTGADVVLMESPVTIDEALARAGYLLMTVNEMEGVVPSRVHGVTIIVGLGGIWPQASTMSPPATQLIFIGRNALKNLTPEVARNGGPAERTVSARMLSNILKQSYR